MKKIAFIIIRYGAEVNGGAEVHCRMLAERLTPYYEVEVLTTTTRDFNCPERDYPAGESVVNGVTVRRFRPEPIDGERYGWYRRQTRKTRRLRYRLAQLGLLAPIASVHPAWNAGMANNLRYLESQADHTPSMLRYIAERQEEYAALLFMNFYFSQTVLGSVIAPRKSILIPLAHPEKVLYLPVNIPMFTRVRHIAFNTEAERRLCRGAFGCRLAPSSIVGVGIELTPSDAWGDVQAKYGLPDDYVLYLGRVTQAKINDLIPQFIRYRKTRNPDARLVLVGGIDPLLPLPDDEGVILTGFVTEVEKSAIVRHATLMVNPSHLESLSLLMLEAMACRIPLLVNGRSEVMKDHCKSSGAALWYNNERDFLRKLHKLLTDSELRRTMSERGPAYVEAHYSWEVIIPKLREIIESI